MLAWLKETWYFFVALALAQTGRIFLFLNTPDWHPQIVSLTFNFILILTSFFISWRSYARYKSVLTGFAGATALYLFSYVLVNIVVTLLIVYYTSPFLLTSALKQLPGAIDNSFTFLPLVLILAYLACRVFQRRELKNKRIHGEAN